MSRHRAGGRASYASYPATFIPSHCTGRPSSGGNCLHAHPSEPAWDPFPGLDVPIVPPECGRKGSHGAHDVTSSKPGEPVFWRCPGHVQPAALPKVRVTERVVQARAAIRGGVR